MVFFFSRFVDCDILMRFHWGLDIRHVYTHQQHCTNTDVVWCNPESDSDQGDPSGNDPDSPEPTGNNVGSGAGTDGSISDSDDGDYKLSEGDCDDESSNDNKCLLDMDKMHLLSLLLSSSQSPSDSL